MDEQSAIKNNNNWVRCQSKSRPGQYYMFNKKTGETRWATESSDKTQQNISAKLKMKTPAQDRLKRLQTNLEKSKHKDSSLGKAKDGLKNKKLDFSSEKRVEGPLRDKPSSTNEEVSATSRNKTAKETSVSTEKSTSQSDVEKNSPVASEEDKNAVQSDTNKFRIPKKLTSQPEDNSKKKVAKRKHNEVNSTSSSVPPEQLYNKSTKGSSRLRKEINNACSPKKTRISNEFQTNEGKTSPDAEKKVQYDLNDNIAPSTDQKSTIMSALKGYCTSLFKKVVQTNKGSKSEVPTKQSNLSHSSKPSFKSKKPVQKASLQENQNRRQRPMPQCSANTTLPSSSSIGCANDRLKRLRKSLQDQQTFLNRSQPIPSPTSYSFVSTPSKDSVCSLSASHNESESMDWQPICEDSTLNNTTSSSMSNVSTRSEHWETVNENLLRLAADKKQQEKHWKTDYFYFVIDTNVFLENVTFVDELTTMKLCDTAGTLIYIPYCVLQELDKLKIRSPSESIKTRSTRAIHYINKAFENKAQHIQAQSSADENRHLVRVTSPDDSILNCCLQVKEHIENVMLLTEDINLRSKAMCSDILVSTKSDLISKHESLL